VQRISYAQQDTIKKLLRKYSVAPYYASTVEGNVTFAGPGLNHRFCVNATHKTHVTLQTATPAERTLREVVTMFRNPDNSSAHGVPVLFNLTFLVGFLLLFACREAISTVADVSDRAFTWASGHLGPRPDPWLENRLRNAFAEIDRDLTAILHDGPTLRLPACVLRWRP
jgi:hypothetical protein